MKDGIHVGLVLQMDMTGNRKFLTTAFAVAGISLSMAAREPEISVAKWKDGKACAVCFTFDDGLKDQAVIAAPELEKRGWKGTFFINASMIDGEIRPRPDRMNWDDVADLFSAGHEISNHGWAHRKLTKIPFDEAVIEIERNDSAILARTGSFPLTFCYPYNAKDEKIAATASEKRVGTRMKQYAFGNASPDVQLHKRLDNAIAKNDAAVWMTHGIESGYDSFGDEVRRFAAFLDYVKSREDSIWVTTFVHLCMYENLRDSTQLQIESGNVHRNNRSHGKVIVEPVCPLHEELYDIPLTLSVRTPDAASVKAKQNGKRLHATEKDGTVFFDFDPFGGPISVRY